MASRMRSARRRLRKELSRCVKSGQGDRATLDRVAREIMGREVGMEEVAAYFYTNEASNSMSQLRLAGDAESVGGLWLPVESLTDAHVETISIRRLKRLRGEAKAQERLSHDHGRVEEAVLIGRLLELLHQGLASQEPVDADAQVVS